MTKRMGELLRQLEAVLPSDIQSMSSTEVRRTLGALSFVSGMVSYKHPAATAEAPSHHHHQQPNVLSNTARLSQNFTSEGSL